MSGPLPAGHSRAGFTLLEVMIAIAIMALVILPIAAGQTASILYVGRSHAGTTAALLIRGVVLDLEEEFQKDGFPSNSVEGRTCDLPKPFGEQFECEYDLIAMDSELVQQMAEGSMAALLGQGGTGGEEGEGEGEGDAAAALAAGLPEGLPGDVPANLLGGLESIPAAAEQLGPLGLNLGQFDFSKMVALMPLFDPAMQDQLQTLCGINWAAIGQNLMGMIAFLPSVVQKMADNTRQMNVRLTWRYGRKEDRTLQISTFVTGVPEEQIQEQLQAQELQETMQGLTATPDGSPRDTPSPREPPRNRRQDVSPGK